MIKDFTNNGINWTVKEKGENFGHSQEYFIEGIKDGNLYEGIASFAFGSDELEEVKNVEKITLRENQVMAICLKTYKDEDDLDLYDEGKITKDEIKTYYKGEKYPVNSVFYDKEYFELISKQAINNCKPE